MGMFAIVAEGYCLYRWQWMPCSNFLDATDVVAKIIRIHPFGRCFELSDFEDFACPTLEHSFPSSLLQFVSGIWGYIGLSAACLNIDLALLHCA